MTNRTKILTTVFLILLSLSIWTAASRDGHMFSMQHGGNHSSGGQPEKTGQAAYAALIDMVAHLENDSSTDWAKVDIDKLHAHLLDMHHLMISTEATKHIVGNTQIRFEILGNSTSLPSIHRMVPAHSRFIEISRGWDIEVSLNETGAAVSVDVKDVGSLNRLNALGFYGYMSLDSHHQEHHYQMALGISH